VKGALDTNFTVFAVYFRPLSSRLPFTLAVLVVEAAAPTEIIVKQVASTGGYCACRSAATVATSVSSGCVTTALVEPATVVRQAHQPPVEVAVPTEIIVKPVASTGGY
jgi:hypothetical protein